LQCFNKEIEKVKDSKLADWVKIPPLELLTSHAYKFLMEYYFFDKSYGVLLIFFLSKKGKLRMK
jgi:hypothetical protein